MTRSQKRSFRKTIYLSLKLGLLILLFWGGIQPVFTDLFEAGRMEKGEQVDVHEKQVNMPTDTLMEKFSLCYPTD